MYENNSNYVLQKQGVTKGSYHNSKPVKVGKPSHSGGGLRFYLVFPNLEVGKWFL